MTVPWTRYVALGDSFTEGMSDEDPQRPDHYIGWADRLAGDLARRVDPVGPPLAYANLAVRGRLLADIVGPQLDAALDLGPDLVSLIGGGNDCLRPGADTERLAADLEQAVIRLRQSGADVLLGVPVDPRDSPFVRRTRGTVAAFAMHTWSIARRHGCHVLDLWGFAPLRDWRMWAPDRIHLTSEAHARVALLALDALGIDPEGAADAGAEWRVPLPLGPAPSRADRMRSDADWFVAYAVPWVKRRLRGQSSGDGRTAKRPLLGPPPGFLES